MRPFENLVAAAVGAGIEQQSLQRRPHGRGRKCAAAEHGSGSPIGALSRAGVFGHRLGDETADALGGLDEVAVGQMGIARGCAVTERTLPVDSLRRGKNERWPEGPMRRTRPDTASSQRL